MFKALHDWLKWRIAGRELAMLHRYRVAMTQYDQWLAEFPDVRLTLTNLHAEVTGELTLNGCHPPTLGSGPWTVSGLREVLRLGRAVAAHSRRAAGHPVTPNA